MHKLAYDAIRGKNAPGVQYGKQYVPVSADDEAYLAYKPERGIHLLGFMPAESVPQYQHLKACIPITSPTAYTLLS